MVLIDLYKYLDIRVLYLNKSRGIINVIFKILFEIILVYFFVYFSMLVLLVCGMVIFTLFL